MNENPPDQSLLYQEYWKIVKEFNQANQEFMDSIQKLKQQRQFEMGLAFEKYSNLNAIKNKRNNAMGFFVLSIIIFLMLLASHSTVAVLPGIIFVVTAIYLVITDGKIAEYNKLRIEIESFTPEFLLSANDSLKYKKPSIS